MEGRKRQTSGASDCEIGISQGPRDLVLGALVFLSSWVGHEKDVATRGHLRLTTRFAAGWTALDFQLGSGFAMSSIAVEAYFAVGGEVWARAEVRCVMSKDAVATYFVMHRNSFLKHVFGALKTNEITAVIYWS